MTNLDIFRKTYPSTLRSDNHLLVNVFNFLLGN